MTQSANHIQVKMARNAAGNAAAFSSNSRSSSVWIRNAHQTIAVTMAASGTMTSIHRTPLGSGFIA